MPLKLSLHLPQERPQPSPQSQVHLNDNLLSTGSGISPKPWQRGGRTLCFWMGYGYGSLNVPRGHRSGWSLRSDLIFVCDSDKCTLPAFREATGRLARDPPRPPPVSSASASDCLCLRTRRLTCRHLRSLNTFCSWKFSVNIFSPTCRIKPQIIHFALM